jgi:hypothetical protein
MDAALLDTDTLSEVLKGRNANVRLPAMTYVQQQGHFAWIAGLRLEDWRQP